MMACMRVSMQPVSVCLFHAISPAVQQTQWLDITTSQMLSHLLFHTFISQVKTGEVSQDIADQRVLDKDPAHRLVIVDGAVSAQLSSTEQLRDGVFIGTLQDASDQATVDSLVRHDVDVDHIDFLICVRVCL